MSHVLGIDLDVRAIHLVLVNGDTGAARYLPAPIKDKRGSFDATRNVRDAIRAARVPWDDVWLVGMERPFTQSRGTARVQGLLTGAVLASVPRATCVLDMAPNDRDSGWKALCDLPTNASKDQVREWATVELLAAGSWAAFADAPQDAHDAYCLARAAQRLNERARAA